jgi:hypothetical protein
MHFKGHVSEFMMNTIAIPQIGHDMCMWAADPEFIKRKINLIIRGGGGEHDPETFAAHYYAAPFRLGKGGQ